VDQDDLPDKMGETMEAQTGSGEDLLLGQGVDFE
jgi:hypothetical protein